MHFSLITVCGLLTAAIAAPAPNSKRHVVHERRDRLPTHWNKNAKLHGDSFMPLRIALTQSNLDRADEFLMDVSHPASPNYGKHWSAKQIAETFAPSEETVTSITNWLADYGITSDRVKQSQSLNWIHVNMTVSEAEQLLKTKYYEYKYSFSDETHVACDEYSVPKDIQGHVDFITPTVHFDVKLKNPKKKRDLDANEIEIAKRQTAAAGHDVQPGTAKAVGNPNDGSLPKAGGKVPFGTILNQLENCDISIVPNCLRALYLFPPDFPANPKNSYGIVEYTPQAYLPSDLDMFFRNFSPSQVGDRPIFDSIDGGFLQTDMESFNYNGESDLDLEYAMSLVYPQKVTLYQVGDELEGASFNNFLDAIDGNYCTYEGGDDPNQDAVYPDPYGSGPGVYKGPENCGGFAATKVISTSYGYNEADLTPFYENRQCSEYMKLGLQGITFLYSSGDYGVAGNGGQCIDPTTGNYTDGSYGMFNPSFPGTCPYVTSVGATQVKPGASVTQPEEAAESVIYSGGGFSNVFSLPSYQKSAVSTYFAQHKPSYGPDRYNTSQQSRGIPDVSANGVNYVIAIDGNFSYVYGTSASSPTFGSVLTLVNAARLDVGKKSIGFINPVIYQNPGMFNDITSGGNQGCGTPGFTAVSGWDPVTGLGTPNFPKMLKVWLGLP
ncbi:probable tripeptidyl-peptidase 1 precursor [Phialocephala subalpina]|uniref:tripeptidyl-peptidase II n=1 Tax=Phialocephala subalpina TaxID=576137 RepID=A0A1L7WZG3_9HELO|nr:probable tripeptidyl-peptidase 1 precursor [Phialocephala subalpina]